MLSYENLFIHDGFQVKLSPVIVSLFKIVLAVNDQIIFKRLAVVANLYVKCLFKRVYRVLFLQRDTGLMILSIRVGLGQ